jgi:hypothetical protein
LPDVSWTAVRPVPGAFNRLKRSDSGISIASTVSGQRGAADQRSRAVFTGQQQKAHGILVRHFRCSRLRSRADRLNEAELSVRVDVTDQATPSPHHHRQIGFAVKQPVVDSPGHGVTEKGGAAGLGVGALVRIVEV